MIEIFGAQVGQEYEAARRLERSILDKWPDLETRPKDIISIYVGLKCYGEIYQDIDIFVVGSFHTAREFNILPGFISRGSEKTAKIKSFAWVIEEKSHDASGVRFNGQHAEVRYSGDWFDVTEKNERQKHSVKNFLSKKLDATPWITGLVFFTGLHEASLPSRPHAMFGLDCSFERLLNIHIENANRAPFKGVHSADFGNGETENLIKNRHSIFTKLSPSTLDRRKMDRIAKKNPLLAELGNSLGEKQISIRGRGGVGKTIMLQQMAYNAYDDFGKRSLILTYNHALVADIKRSMSQLGIVDSLERGTVQVRTSTGFISAVLKKLGIYDDLKNPIKSYEASKLNFTNYLKDGLLTNEDFKSLTSVSNTSLNTRIEEFYWDYIFIDEGQDWPQDEIKILQHFYGSHKLIIADGVDQFVRPHRADWTLTNSDEKFKVQKLKTCLRMKSNLVTFVNNIAQELDLAEWELEDNKDATGGKIKIYEGDLRKGFPDFMIKICEEAKSQKNEVVDLLTCVPPSQVDHNQSPPSAPGRSLLNAGVEIWDATSVYDETRGSFPTSLDQLRIVQYESCRGLEGWITINFGLDEFFAYKHRASLNSYNKNNATLLSKKETAQRQAALWLMIPLTRAMDTLVLNVTKKDSELKTALKAVYDRFPDFIEWHII